MTDLDTTDDTLESPPVRGGPWGWIIATVGGLGALGVAGIGAVLALVVVVIVVAVVMFAESSALLPFIYTVI